MTWQLSFSIPVVSLHSPVVLHRIAINCLNLELDRIFRLQNHFACERSPWHYCVLAVWQCFQIHFHEMAIVLLLAQVIRLLLPIQTRNHCHQIQWPKMFAHFARHTQFQRTEKRKSNQVNNEINDYRAFLRRKKSEWKLITDLLLTILLHIDWNDWRAHNHFRIVEK